jgi:hypothetical protein
LQTMPNELTTPSGGLAQFLESFNLPHMLAGPAGKAISRLVGAAVEIPAVRLERISAGIRDKTEAKTSLSKALANAAVKRAVANPDLVERTCYRRNAVRQIRKLSR